MSNENEKINDPQKPKLRETHTPENTTMGNPVAMEALEVKGDVNKDGVDPRHAIFIGTDKSNYVKNLTLINKYTEWRAALLSTTIKKNKREEVEKAYRDFADQNYPHLSEDELVNFIQDFFSYVNEVMEPAYLRSTYNSRVLDAISEMADNKFEPDIVPRYPVAKNAALSLTEKMTRASNSRSNTPNAYDCLLRNSFIQVRVNRSDLNSLGMLVERMNREVHGYVQKINGNSMTLARATIYKEAWNHISERIVKHSVSDIDSVDNLADLITISDFRTLLVQMLAEVSDSGIPVQLYCHQDKCDWSAVKYLDPALLVKHDKSCFNAEQNAILGNLKNWVKSYKVEELREAKSQFNFVNRPVIDYKDGTHHLTLSEPSLSHYFIAFDLFFENVDPYIKELRTQIIDDKKYAEQLQLLIDSVRGCEYLHWCDTLTIDPEDGSDAEPEVFRRDEDPIGFYTAMYTLVNEDTELSTKLIRWAMENGPLMSSTIIGVSNETCPKCRKDFGGETAVSGITPVDPLYQVFTHVHLTLVERVVDRSVADVISTR